MSTCTRMFNYLIKLFVILTACVFFSNGQISDKRLCADEFCKVAISKAKTLMAYGSSGTGILSFKANDDAIIYSKSAGSRLDLWGAVINGKRGYIPKLHVRELKIFVDKLDYLVDTEKEDVPLSNQQVVNIPKPDAVQQPYEVHDGTVIYPDTIDKQAAENTLEGVTQTTEPLLNVNTKSQVIVEPEVKPNIVSQVIESFNSWIEGSGSGDATLENENEDFIVVKGEGDEDDVTEKKDNKNESTFEEIDKSYNVDIAKGVIEINDEREEYTSDLVQKSNGDDDKDIEIIKEGFSKVSHNLDNKISQNSDFPPPVTKLSAQNILIKPIENVLVESNSAQQVLLESSEMNKFVQENKVENLILESNSMEEGLVKPINNVFGESSTPQQVLIEPSKMEEFVQEKNVENLISKSDSLKDGLVKPTENVFEEINSAEQVPKDSSQMKEFVQENKVDYKVGSLIFESNSAKEVNAVTDVSDSNSNQNVAPNIIDSSPNQQALNPENYLNPDVDSSKLIEHSVNSLSDEEIKVDLTNSAEENLLSFTTKNKLPLQQNQQVSSFPSNKPSSDEIMAETKPFQHLMSTEETSNILIDNSDKNDLSTKKQDLSTGDDIENLNSAENLTKFVDTTNSVHTEDIKESISKTLDESLLDFTSEKSVKEMIENVNQNDQNHFSDTLEKTMFDDSNIITVPTDEEKISINENTITELKTEHLPIENNVQNARDILWASTMRKPILENNHHHDQYEELISKKVEDDFSCAANPSHSDCLISEKYIKAEENSTTSGFDLADFNIFIWSKMIMFLIITATTIVIFLWGYMMIDKSAKERKLIAKINNLEKIYLVMQKENQILNEKLESGDVKEPCSSDSINVLKQELDKLNSIITCKEQVIHNLEKELSNSTEIGLELNRMLSEFLNSENGSSTIVANVEQLQRQIIEQQDIINNCNNNLAIKDTENHELRLELDINNTKVIDLQSELNKMALNLLKLEEDKEQLQSNYTTEILELNNKLSQVSNELKQLKLTNEFIERQLELKTHEYTLLKESLSVNGSNNDEARDSLVDISAVKAELMLLQKEKQVLTEKLKYEINEKTSLEELSQLANQEIEVLKTKYDMADREKLEAQTKLQVLSNYFKEKETQLQKDLSKQESLWIEKQDETSSTIERIKYMQDELQNSKIQYESLKQEIIAQEVEMKSQISVLEKRAHENWVSARQAERKLEDAKQEAAQLRNRLTLRERNFNEEKIQNQQNGDTHTSPLTIDGVNNSLLYNARDHLTTSPPPLTGLPPFMPPPPPPGVAFIPPPLGGVRIPPPGFLPPPPSIMPGDHRPPPLGRMSSPPINSRYSPDLRYSPFRKNSPLPTSDDDYDRSSPPPPPTHLYRGYNPYSRDDERRDFNRPSLPNRNKLRHNKGAAYSSGSVNSNESLEKLNHSNSKV